MFLHTLIEHFVKIGENLYLRNSIFRQFPLRQRDYYSSPIPIKIYYDSYRNAMVTILKLTSFKKTVALEFIIILNNLIQTNQRFFLKCREIS